VPVSVIATVHNNLTQIWQEGSFKDRLIIRLLRFFYPRTQCVVAVSEGVAEGLIKMTGISPGQVDVVYNPVVTSELFQKAAEIPDHPWLADPRKQVILAVGRLTEQKDYPTLIRAFARICQQHDIYLVVLGDGQERQKIEKLIVDFQLEARVDMPGFVSNPFAYMSHADLFVLSSRHEGLPTVLIEAMACGCPVVSTDCPSGPAEILDNGHYGQLVPVADVARLAEAIVSTLKDLPSRNMLVERAKLYSVSNSVQAYKKLFMSLESKSKK
jgi:glycosyltransferase involved in cell wall biosynthesis